MVVEWGWELISRMMREVPGSCGQVVTEPRSHPRSSDS